jgi:hypothetical protein
LGVGPPLSRSCYWYSNLAGRCTITDGGSAVAPGQGGRLCQLVRCRRADLGERLSRGFRIAVGDLKPERAFCVYSGNERWPAADRTEVISVRALAAKLASAG